MAKKPKVLIAGDSFSTVWPNTKGSWVDLLSQDAEITNLSQAGIGEYKILKQILSVDISNFDFTIVSHTSPSRIHTKNHPIHRFGLHSQCDLIYNDIKDRFDWFNENLRVSKKFFQYHYDDEYQIDIYKLIRHQIKEKITNRYLAIGHIPISSDLAIEDLYINFSEIWAHHRGTINHYSEQGNLIVYEQIKEKLFV